MTTLITISVMKLARRKPFGRLKDKSKASIPENTNTTTDKL